MHEFLIGAVLLSCDWRPRLSAADLFSVTGRVATSGDRDAGLVDMMG
jgi:hypothetical protein